MGALNILAVNDSTKIAIIDAGAIPALVVLLTSGTDEAKATAAGLFCSLSFNAKIAVAIADAGAIPSLEALRTSGATDAKMYATFALERLSAKNPARVTTNATN